MTAVRRGIDLFVSLVGAAAWGLTAFVLGSRLLSPTAGGLLAVAVATSLLALMLGGHLQEARMSRLAANACPRCGSPVTFEHRHRRWDAARNEWLQPLATWECRRCGYAHNEAWSCPTCPVAA